MPSVAKHSIQWKQIWALGCLAMTMVVCVSGCGFFGGANQLKQLQSENDRLLAEYRAQRDRATKLQETNAALEARVGEAERLLAQGGTSLPASRVSRLDPRPEIRPEIRPGTRLPAGSTSGGIPPYSPPQSPATADVKWRPLRRP